MPAMDEFKEQREAMKDKPLKERLAYYWYYYKGHILVSALVIFTAVVLIHDVITSKGNGFYVAFLNAFATTNEEQDFIKEFADLTDIDQNKYLVYVDTSIRIDTEHFDQASLYSGQKFLAMTSAGEIDVVVSDRDLFSTYSDNGAFMELDDYLTEEQLEKYKDYFYYYDRVLLDQEIDYDAIASEDWTQTKDTVERRDPSTMEDPVAVGIFLDGDMKKRLTDFGFYVDGQELVFGIMAKEEHTAYVRQFIDWLTGM